ncbi:MAG: hypothetical protein U1E14_21175 [Geminicoccaceae bacterium]
MRSSWAVVATLVLLACAPPPAPPQPAAAPKTSAVQEPAVQPQPASQASAPEAAPGAPKLSSSALGQAVMSFHLDPQPGRVPAILDALDREVAGMDDSTIQARGAPLMGWLYGVFLQFPDDVPAWTAPERSHWMNLLVALALMLSGDEDEALDYARRSGIDETQLRALWKQTDTIFSTTARSPFAADALWGAAFATGDRAYVGHIVDALNDPALAPYADTLVTVAQGGKVSLPPGISQANALAFATAGSVIWSLVSNASRMPFVHAELEATARAKGLTPSGRRLIEATLQAADARIAR